LARGLTPKVEGFAGDVLAEIDWSQPWFAPWRELGEPTAHLALQQRSVAEALNAINHAAKGLTSSQSQLPQVILLSWAHQF